MKMKEMGLERCIGQTDLSIRDSGKLEFNMAWAK